MKLIKEQTKVNPIAIKEAPKNLPLGRLDDVKAVKELNVKF
jgi:hypothetical protein